MEQGIPLHSHYRVHALSLQQKDSLRREALRYLDMGWCVLPTIGKRPICKWKRFQDECITRQELLDLIDCPRVTGAAAVLGTASRGLSDRDWDVAGEYEKWAGENRKLAREVPTYRSGFGYHMLFRGPPGYQAFGDGEYRADPRHISVVPPSLHPSGVFYEWVIPLRERLPEIDPIEVGLIPHLDPPREGRASRKADAEGIPRGNGRMWAPGAEVKQAVSRCLPGRRGERNQRLLDLSRALKGTQVAWTLGKLKAAFLLWWREAEPVVRTKDRMTSWGEFLAAFRLCEKPRERGLDVERTLRECRQHDLPPRAKALPERLQTLLLCCIQLQAHSGGPFFLSQEDAGRLLEVRRETANRYMRQLQEGGFIERVSTGSNLNGRASVYRLLP